jgi:hypothetical protein
MTCGGLFCGKTTLNKGEHKGTQQAWPSTLFNEASRLFGVALCRKQVFFVKMTQGEVYSKFVKGIRECLAISFDHGATTKSLPWEPTLLGSPSRPEEVIQSLTLKLALLRLGSCCLWSSICLQVVLNRRHGFLKIFNPTRVHNFTHTWQPSPRPLQGVLAECCSPITFTSCRPIPWATPKGFSPPSQDGRSLMRNRLLWVRVGLPEGPSQPTSAKSLYDAPPPLIFSKKKFNAYVKWKARTR